MVIKSEEVEIKEEELPEHLRLPKKKGFFARFKESLKKKTCVFCGKKSKSGFCASCRKEYPEMVRESQSFRKVERM